jgi:acetyl esterase/lipase
LRSHSAELKIDPARIALMGDSAGAHLSELVALAGDSSDVSMPANCWATAGSIEIGHSPGRVYFSTTIQIATSNSRLR